MLSLLGLGLLLSLLAFVVSMRLVALAFALLLALVTLLNRGDFGDFAAIANLLMSHPRCLSSCL